MSAKVVKQSRGEFLVLQRLSEIARDQGWLVLRNFRLEHHHTKVESEIDVVAFAGSLGIILLEVKGSSVRVFDGQWASLNRGSQKWENIQDPLEQIKENKYAFRETTRQIMRQFKANPIISWGAVFPESDAVQGTVSYPSWRICNGSQLDSLELFIENLVRKQKAKLSNLDRRMLGGLDLRTAHSIVSQLIPKDIDALDISSDYNAALNELETESRSVKDMMDMVKSIPFVVLEGAAGTGKTRAAMYVSRKCISSGNDVLFLCSSRSFSRHVGRIFDMMIPGRAQVWCSGDGQPIPDFQNVAMLVLDEAQDLVGLEVVRSAMAEAADMGLPTRVFGDFDGQNLFDDKSVFFQWLTEKGIDYTPLQLSKNCRNTETIGKALKSFHAGDTSSLSFSSIRGERVEVLPPVGKAQLGSSIANLIEGWVDKGNPIGGITVLHTLDGDGTEMGEDVLDSFGGCPMLKASESVDFAIPVSSIMNFKGLESPCVILVLEDIGPSMDKALYIALSRARLKVYIVLMDTIDQTQLKDWVCKISGRN